MKISLLQPKIVRGDIDHNTKVIQRLIDSSKGELLVLPEYALTGSLVLDLGADVQDWAARSSAAEERLRLQKGQKLLLNRLTSINGTLYNSCRLLPDGGTQQKMFPDPPEVAAGIKAGNKQQVFSIKGKRFKVIICTDLRQMEKVPTNELDFILFIFHFTENNYSQAMPEVKDIAVERNLPILVSSLVSDVNIGSSSYVNADVTVSLPAEEGILEVTL